MTTLTIPRPDSWSQPLGVAALGTIAMMAIMAMAEYTSSSFDVEIQDAAAFCENTINASTASEADVEAAIAAASAGDCVVVPPDASESWSGGITISGIALIGPGKNAGSPTVITAGTVDVVKHATHITRLIGFRFTQTGSGILLDVTGSVSNEPFIIHNNFFTMDGGGSPSIDIHVQTNGGLFSENDFVAPTCHGSNSFIFSLGGSAGTPAETSWQTALQRGDEDTDGTGNTYLEDNLWSGILEGGIDNDNGARLVVRNNLIQDSRFGTHGGGSGNGGQDTSIYGGRWIEMYDNTFDRVSNSCALNYWHWQRGSTGIFANNSLEDASSPDGSSFPNKREIVMSVGCPGNPGYPMPYQVGQSTQTPDSTPDSPFLIFGNTGAGASSGNFINVSGDSGEGITCSVPNNYIQASRDYFTSNSWSWSPLEYPHPLHPEIDGSGDL